MDDGGAGGMGGMGMGIGTGMDGWMGNIAENIKEGKREQVIPMCRPLIKHTPQFTSPEIRRGTGGCKRKEDADGK